MDKARRRRGRNRGRRDATFGSQSSLHPMEQLQSSLRTLCIRSHPRCLNARHFNTASACQASTRKRREYRDPYAAAQAKARKAANQSRQGALKQQRLESLGDPIRGVETPFVRSFDTVNVESSGTDLLNYSVDGQELESSAARSKDLCKPVRSFVQRNKSQDDSDLQRRHNTAIEALKRITSLTNASSKDRLRANISRCVGTFGRHHTDTQLAPRASVSATVADVLASPKIERAGPDTGSSEVQIAILTARIRALADGLTLRGLPDKANKRNLRLLVHKRQKLLAYLRRKERGGPRWTHCIAKLGLTEGTWKGEISL